MRKNKSNIPNLDICNLSATREDDLMIDRFSKYLDEHKNLVFPHRHRFYQLVLFTKGGGSHTIDFKKYAVQPFQIYFMIPGQVHTWDFEGEMDGYVVNFSSLFFQAFLLRPDYLRYFSFFTGISGDHVIDISEKTRKVVEGLFEALLQYRQAAGVLWEDMVRVLLLQIFIILEQTESNQSSPNRGVVKNEVLRRFQQLVDIHFVDIKLPNKYAELLSITPNHLNALTKEHLGKHAVDVIRDRIILEAKRLLVSVDLTVSEIAHGLNFNDNSYFIRFFKKATGTSPELFRKSF